MDAWLDSQPGLHASSADAGAALTWLAERNAGPPLVVNPARIFPRDITGRAWTGVNNLANFDSLPRGIIAGFIQTGAATFHRPGWLLIDRAQSGDWLELFELAYNVAEERAFGGYEGYRMVPK